MAGALDVFFSFSGRYCTLRCKTYSCHVDSSAQQMGVLGAVWHFWKDAERSAFDRTRIDSDPCPCCWFCRLQKCQKRFCLKTRHLQISWLIIIFLIIMAQHGETCIIFRHTQLVIRFLIADRRLISILTKITREPKGAKLEDSQWEHVNWHQWTLFLDDWLRH